MTRFYLDAEEKYLGKVVTYVEVDNPGPDAVPYLCANQDCTTALDKDTILNLFRKGLLIVDMTPLFAYVADPKPEHVYSVPRSIHVIEGYAVVTISYPRWSPEIAGEAIGSESESMYVYSSEFHK